MAVVSLWLETTSLLLLCLSCPSRSARIPRRECDRDTWRRTSYKFLDGRSFLGRIQTWRQETIVRVGMTKNRRVGIATKSKRFNWGFEKMDILNISGHAIGSISEAFSILPPSRAVIRKSNGDSYGHAWAYPSTYSSLDSSKVEVLVMDNEGILVADMRPVSLAVNEWAIEDLSTDWDPLILVGIASYFARKD